MINTAKLKKYRLQILTIFLYAITFVYNTEIFERALKTTGGYLKEMVQILPAVFILSALITTWVPKEVIIRNFGKDSGLKGKLLSIFIGSVSAGPIYAAFPLAHSLLMKEASLSNVVIIISSWAVIKIPMLIVETKFLGFGFAGSRLILTIPAVLLIGYFTEKLMFKEKLIINNTYMDSNYQLIENINNVLPQYNCRRCGFESCRKYAENIVENNTRPDKCKLGGKRTTAQIKKLLSQEDDL
ncbi:hypothetical protein BBF96_04875 [Anoxybacter fermentans]|uniref:4Fe-4S domain-containing protein n=1 Tax=Anoxybacter fermentans TaxID=1323375 RepID=A0A3S9SWX0_9FIRM|nr:permease [Anoxybacter fermentans]AZR72785.1 hypothetical protein BBF96_04875 [Anoxybacter fermentans]